MTITVDREAGSVGFLKSAHSLRVYFEQRLKTKLDFIVEAPLGEVQEPLCIPFDYRIAKLGLWGLRSQSRLRLPDIKEIADTFSCVLGSINDLQDRRHRLQGLQKQLEGTQKDSPSNVIPLRRSVPLNSSPFSNMDQRWEMRLDCLIESRQIAEIHKMALELHSQGNRYAFIEYRNLNRTTRLSLLDLLSLGQITLFIPSILDLTLAEQGILKRLIHLESLERPLVIAGTTLPFGDLRLEPAVHPEFLQLIARAYIKLTRPFVEYKEEGLIHYFLDSLSQNPT